MPDMPTAEIDIDLPLTRRLLRGQHPDLAELPLRPAANGWDNAMIRLGDDLVVRLPRRRAAAELVRHEQLVLPRLAGHLPVPVPVPVRTGRATEDYPWPWTVAHWLPGQVAADQPARERDAWAGQLAEFFAALHRPADADAPANPVRGVPLAQRAAVIRDRLATATFAGAPELLAQFDRASAASIHPGPPRWLHGDPHPLNLLASAGRLTGVIDFGDTTGGDPATDLATAWLTFTAAGRAEFIRRYTAATGADAATWERARAWAINYTAVLLSSSDDHAQLAAIGTHARGELLAPG